MLSPTHQISSSNIITQYIIKNDHATQIPPRHPGRVPSPLTPLRPSLSTQLEQILRGRIQLPDAEDEDEDEPETPEAPPAAAAAPAVAEAAAAPLVAVAAGKKGYTDSGMDSGLGITQELTSACDLASAADLATPPAAARRDTGGRGYELGGASVWAELLLLSGAVVWGWEWLS